jgi:hypothetical protein
MRSVFLLLLFTLGCAGQVLRPYESLYDSGPHVLSTSSPYLAQNLFLGEALGRSLFLKEFFEDIGSPDAISLQSSPHEMTLYYLQSNFEYRATSEEVLSSPQNKITEWVVRGPYQIPREVRRILEKHLNILPCKTPIFLLRGRKVTFGCKEMKNSPKKRERRIIVPQFIVPQKTQVIQSPRKIKVIKENKVTGKRTPEKAKHVVKPQNFDQEALAATQN